MKFRNIHIYLLGIIITGLLAACAPSATPTLVLTALPGEQETEEPTVDPVVAAFPIQVTDALGNEFTVEQPPQRIISLTLGTDELLLALVGPDRLIGVTYLASDPSTSNIAEDPDLASVANTVEADPEQLIALEPDLIFVGSFTDPAVVEQLQNAGINVYAVGNFTSIDAMADNVLRIGEVVGETPRASEIVTDMQVELVRIDSAITADEQPTILYYSSGGWVAGSDTTVDDIILHAHGINAAAEVGLVDWNQINEEAVIEMDPDFVILSPWVTDEEFVTNPAFADLSAVQNGQAVAISDAYMSATSQYITHGVEALAAILYPDLVSAP